MKAVRQLEVHPDYGRAMERSRGKTRLALKVLHRFLPLHTLKHLQAEIPLMLLRLRSSAVASRYKGASDLMVNIGPGAAGKSGWVNLDVRNAPGVNCIYDCRKSLPFPDGSVRGIFSEHVFEHLDYTEEVPYFLSECYRVLQPGGVIRLIMPDAEKYLRAYCNGGWEEFTRIRPLGPDRTDLNLQGRYNTRMELVNVVFRQGHEHKFAYDFETLNFLLSRYGFTKVVHQEYGASLMAELSIEQLGRSVESIYVDAQK